MSLVKGVAGAVAGGAVGGALWVGVALATGWELSLIAIIVGGCVGFGMGMGNQGRGGLGAGLLAACVTFLCVIGAKAGVAHVVAQRWMAEQSLEVTEEDARTALMETVYTSFSDEGVPMTEPEDEDDFPPEVWTEADRRWHAMSVAEREGYRAGLEQELRAGMEEAGGVFTLLAFIFSFGLFDLVCISLAMGTAFKTASTTVKKDEVEEPDEVAAAPALFRAAAQAAAGPAPIAAIPAGPAPARAPAPAARPEQAPSPPASLGIFAMLGNEPTPPARSMLDPAPAAPAGCTPPRSPRSELPEQRAGLINLEIDEEGQTLAA